MLLVKCRNHIAKSFSSDKMIDAYKSYYLDIKNQFATSLQQFKKFQRLSAIQRIFEVL